MKTVFVLGAGASVECGGPTMANFLDCAEDVSLYASQISAEERKDFQDVFDAIADLYGIYAKSFLDLNNIETLFGAVEVGLILNKFGKRNTPSIEKLKKSIITLICSTLELSIKFPVRNKHADPAPPYNSFISDLQVYLEKHKIALPNQEKVSFVTFNYDIVLDQALNSKGIRFDYFLPEDERIKNAIPLLKLHGSVNWGLCKKCNKVFTIPIDCSVEQFHELKDYQYLFHTMIQKTVHCDESLEQHTLIVPPTWNKTGYHEEISHVWKKAASELETAVNIVIIGYSMPETDQFFRYLFALGTQSRTRIRNFIVVNPDKTIEERFRNLAGRGIANRFKFIHSGLGTAINEIFLII